VLQEKQTGCAGKNGSNIAQPTRGQEGGVRVTGGITPIYNHTGIPTNIKEGMKGGEE